MTAAPSQGREVYGCKVIGRIADLERLAQELKVRHAIIAMPGERRGFHRVSGQRLCASGGQGDDRAGPR